MGIETEFDKKTRSIKTQNKIKMGKDMSEMRMKVLQEADEILAKIKEEARERVSKLSTNAAMYKPFLQSLIMEALVRINEPIVQIICRKEDLALVQSVAGPARDAFVAAAKASKFDYLEDVKKSCTVTVIDSAFLPEGPEKVASKELPSCCGGIVAVNQKNNISCSNTLDSRLDIAFEEQLPAVRKMLFGNLVIGEMGA